jgi:hypothetical protein
VPALRLERLSESVWQLRSDHMLRELADLPAFEAPQAPVPASAFRVEVANGNGAAGLARRVSTLLPPQALQPARLTNQKPYGATLSVIEHVAGAEQEAAAVNARLPAQLPLFRVHALERSAQVRVLLGRDFPRDVETHEAALPATRLAAS